MKVALVTVDDRDTHGRHDQPDPVFGTPIEALLQGFQNEREVEIHIVSCTQKPMRAPEKIHDHIFYHSLKIGKWGWMRGGYAGCVLAVRKKLREIKPDIVHGQGTERYCALSAVLSGFPNVVTIHGKMVEVARYQRESGAILFYWCAARIEEFTLPRTDGIVCISEYMKGLVEKYKVPAWVVSNALQGIFFDAPVERVSGARKPVLINVGVISERKRQVELLGMAEKLHASGAVFEIEFAGSCQESSAYGREFLAKLKAAETAGYARYVGMLEPGELLKRLDAARAMIHFPSEEAFGLAAAEGLARNLKFFGTRTGGITGIAADVEGAELIDTDDWEGLEAAIRRWLESGAPVPRTAAVEMKARYHPRAIASRHLEIYREVLEGKKFREAVKKFLKCPRE